jgi:uncharacterized protein (DUF2141 family)
MTSRPLCLALASLVLMAAPPAPLPNIEIEARATHLRNTKGNLVFCLWTATDPGFPMGDRGRPFRKLTVDAARAKVVFRDIPTGTYAISVFHDEKGTGAIDRNLLGFPRSGVGATGEFSKPPSFSKSQFTATVGQSLTIQVQYLM